MSAVALPTLPSSVIVMPPLLLFPAPGKLLSSASWEADMVMVVDSRRGVVAGVQRGGEGVAVARAPSPLKVERFVVNAASPLAVKPVSFRFAV